MEQVHRYHAMGTSELRAMGKRGVEWDLNDWKWDGDLFIATPNNFQGQQFIPVVPAPGNSSNSSSSCSDDVQYVIEDGRRDLERKRRVVVVEEESLEEAGPLTLKLGGNGFPVQDREKEGCDWEGASGKKTKLTGGSTCRAACQVEGCGADLSKAKDYHRRHKVCEAHSKATKALVANVMQRFCQQCSRFHALQEFDEGKRSCRRRLAGHNKRRRKTQPDNAVHGNPINDDQTNGVLLMSLLRILSNVHANNRSDQTTNQDLVAQLLSSLANSSGLHMGKGLSGLIHESQKLLNGGMSNNGHSEKLSAFLSNDNRLPPKVPSPDPENSRRGSYAANSRGGEMQAVSSQEPGSFFPIKDSPPPYSDSTAGRMKLNNFDLNDVYVDSDDGMDDLERSPENGNFATASVNFPSWAQQNSQQSSPPQTSGNSDSASAQSPSSSSGEAQSRTDRIVFKLFGKEPSDFPLVLRGQILDWLAHSPTDIESYIRPGCIILTIYLRLTESLWEELCSDLSSCLSRLFDISDDTFWRTGWVYVRVKNKIAFVHNGQVVLDTSLSLQNSNCSRILSVMPIAVSMDEQARFEVRGCNLSRSTTRLLCALEGKYLDQEAAQESNDDDDDDDDLPEEDDETEHTNLSCSIPNVSGRGYIEVEDHGLSSSFFPFLVAEKDVCSEIRTLENVLELKKNDEDAYEINGNSETRRQAMEFINEMGWLLHRSNLKSRLAEQDPNAVIFSFRRFKWLMDFSMDHDWSAVVKKLVDILVAGTVGSGEHSSLKVALSELGLLHRAVRRNSKSMVEQLLRYVPVNVSEEFISFADGSQETFLFQPDAQGPAGLTPLHIAAGKDGSEDVLNALIDDPGKIGINAWKTAQDSTGATPEDYARLRGHYSYIHAVQRKFHQSSASGHVVVDIPGEPSVAPRYDGAVSFEVGRSASFALSQSCKTCDQKKMSAYYGRSITRTALVYRPAMLSMVAIAAVCVCVALLFKSTPNVVCLFQPFRWELVNFGSS